MTTELEIAILQLAAALVAFAASILGFLSALGKLVRNIKERRKK